MSKNNSTIAYPSNEKFGAIFSLFFIGLSVYLFSKGIKFYLDAASLIFGALLGLITLIRPSLLEGIKIRWMKLGDLMGRVVSPLTLGAIFFLIITPVGLILRIFGRDELLLKKSNVSSYWIERRPTSINESFKNQF